MDTLDGAGGNDVLEQGRIVATGLPDGSHEFSRTLAQHEAAVRRYLKRYRQRNSER